MLQLLLLLSFLLDAAGTRPLAFRHTCKRRLNADEMVDVDAVVALEQLTASATLLTTVVVQVLRLKRQH